MKIIVLGSTGMLGNAVGKYFIKECGEDDVYLSYRDKEFSYGKNKFQFECLSNDHVFCKIPKCDYVINCIGIIKPYIQKSIVKSILVNSIFPMKLADYCKDRDCKLIHITTDCVFAGFRGKYKEDDLHDCLDIYGKTKSLGEPDNCMVLRTSIIGEEIQGKVSFVSWVKSQKGKEVNGYVNHYWNGITTEQYAKICSQIMREALYQEGLFHIFSNSVSKYELIHMLGKKFKLYLKIKEVKAETSINRTLSTSKNLQDRLDIPTIEQQIGGM